MAKHALEQAVAQKRVPTRVEIESYLRDRCNWGRWGD
jgi:hypothetical protein